MSRRTFLRDLGHGAFALTVVGLAGCAREAPGSFDPLTYVGNLDEIESFWCADDVRPAEPAQGSDRRWARFGNPNSSGYILVRAGEATVVDTGHWCVPDVIEGGLTAVGLEWSAVGSVVVTHKHPDHWVGLSSALERAADAVVFAGAEDIPHVASPREIVAVGAGDRVIGLAIVRRPATRPVTLPFMTRMRASWSSGTPSRTAGSADSMSFRRARTFRARASRSASWPACPSTHSYRATATRSSAAPGRS